MGFYEAAAKQLHSLTCWCCPT